MIETLKNKNFALLWTGGLISMIGNWILIAAMPFHIYSLTGSALATSGFLIAYLVPGILFGSVAGVFVDRWDRKRTMFVTSLAQAAIVLLLVFVQSAEWVWLVYLAGFIESSLGQFFSPAENALLPRLVGEEHLVSANSLNAMNDNLGRVIGPAVGGALLGVVGFSSVIVADSVSYLIAAVLISLVVSPTRKTADAEPTQTAESEDTAPGGQLRQLWEEWLGGMKLVRHNRVLSAVFLVIGVGLFGDAIISALLVPFVQDVVGVGALEFGWMMTARGLGGIIGGLLLAQIGGRISPRKMLTIGMLSGGVLLLIIVNFPFYWVALVGLLLAGLPVVAWMVSIQTLLQSATDEAYLGRIFGAFGTTTTLLMLIGSLIGGGMGDLINVSLLLSGASLCYVAGGIIAVFLLVRPEMRGEVETRVKSVASGISVD
ncbi:MAG: MFS transporter [Candidatus Promineifilaceae bacterium]